MKTIPAPLLAHFRADSTSIAFLWTIELGDGRMIRGTDHDRNVTLVAAEPGDKYAGKYYARANITLGDLNASADMSVDNTDVTGAFPTPDTSSPPMATVLDVSVQDIEAGLLDRAPVTILVTSWANPSLGYFIAKQATLGPISRDSDGKYTTTVVGLMSLLAQNLIRTYTTSCNVVKFGDSRCGVDVHARTKSGTVTGSPTRLEFAFDFGTDSPTTDFHDSYVGGLVTFTTGENAGFFREIKIDPNTNSGVVQFWEEFPEDILPGDEFTISPGCDRTTGMCKHYQNFVNFKGYGLYVPGIMAITAGPPGAGDT